MICYSITFQKSQKLIKYCRVSSHDQKGDLYRQQKLLAHNVKLRPTPRQAEYLEFIGIFSGGQAFIEAGGFSVCTASVTITRLKRPEF